MARKTRKHTKSTKGIYSIPELRQAFEHVEQVMNEMIHNKESKENMISHIRKEWQKVFHKTLDKSSADALITHRMGSRSMKGGASALAGAPVDYVTRPGVYLDQGSIPGPDGGLTKTVGGGYGSYVQYVDHGFRNPEIAQGYDPVGGQSSFPLPRADMGSNEFIPVTPSVKGGKRILKTRKNKKTREKTRGKTRGKTSGGAAMLDQAFMRPIPGGDAIPHPLFDMQRIGSGATPGLSPDTTQHVMNYKVGSVYPSIVNINV